jgi:hypothetical protein
MMAQTVVALVASGRERYNRRTDRSRLLEKSIEIEKKGAKYDQKFQNGENH